VSPRGTGYARVELTWRDALVKHTTKVVDARPLRLAPFGMIAFLLLGGPTSLIPLPQDRGRRLTGGWAFLLALIVPSTAVVLG
jgi:hypothetical protein